MNRYSAFGQQIESGIQLPGLRSGELPPDITVRRGEIADAEPLNDECGQYVHSSPDGTFSIYRSDDDIYWRYPGIGSLRVTDGEEITVSPAPSTAPEQVRQFVLGPGFRSVLVQQGHLVLHASTIVIEGGAVAFLGESGIGKSTTVAAFGMHGYPLLSDDVSPVFDQKEHGDYVIPPGIQSIRLHPSVASRFREFLESGTGSKSTEKQRYSPISGQSAASQPVPLKRLYLLERGETLSLEPITQRDTMFLLRESSPLYHHSESDVARTHFKKCAGVLDKVSVKRIRRPNSLGALDELIALVENDLRSPSNGSNHGAVDTGG